MLADVLGAVVLWSVLIVYVARFYHLGQYLPSLREGVDPDAESGES